MGPTTSYYEISYHARAALSDQQRQWAAVSRALSDTWPGSGGMLATAGEA